MESTCIQVSVSEGDSDRGLARGRGLKTPDAEEDSSQKLVFKPLCLSDIWRSWLSLFWVLQMTQDISFLSRLNEQI